MIETASPIILAVVFVVAVLKLFGGNNQPRNRK